MKFYIDKKRIITCFFAVLGMGFFLSFLIKCNFGTDPATFMNRSIAAKFHLTFGTCQLLVNAVMLLIVILTDRNFLGFGTIFNMVLVGYYADFFIFLWKKIIPENIFLHPVSRWAVFLISLFFFILSAAIYINSDMGVAPYDALPIIIGEKITKHFNKIPKALIRIFWDALAITLGMIAGGIPIIGIVLMALFLGPVISIVGKKVAGT